MIVLQTIMDVQWINQLDVEIIALPTILNASQIIAEDLQDALQLKWQAIHVERMIYHPA